MSETDCRPRQQTPFISTGTNPEGVPSGLTLQDGVWQVPNVEHNIIADKMLRQSVDADIQRLKSLPGSRERSLAVTKLQEAVMWLGMDLKRINEETGVGGNPYPNSKDPSNTKIEPTADGLKL